MSYVGVFLIVVAFCGLLWMITMEIRNIYGHLRKLEVEIKKAKAHGK